LKGAEKESFLELIRAMLPWVPEVRLTALECLNHPWILKEMD
jgi:hypothetical protein